MSALTRRQLLQRILGGAAGAVILARTVLAETPGEQPSEEARSGPEQRADRLAAELPADGRPQEEPTAFVNGAFRNSGGGGGGFRNSAFRNSGGGGGFRNGGFANGGGGGGAFRNGAFRN